MEDATARVENAQNAKLEEDQPDDQIEEIAVSPSLERNQRIAQDPLFKQLKAKLVAFMRSVKRSILQKSYEISNFRYRKTLYMELRKLLNQILLQPDPEIQRSYLEKIYLWFFDRLRGEKTAILVNPSQKSMKTAENMSSRRDLEREEELSRETAPSVPEGSNVSQFSPKKMDSLEMFERGIRTAHTNIPPAKDRLVDMKTRTIYQEDEQTEGSTRVPDQTDSRANLMSREPVSYFTSKEPVKFQSVNRIEGKSSYMHYVPTNDGREQRLEQLWLQQKNKEIIAKRNEEELIQTVQEWGMAKARLEEEIARKIERVNSGSNFITRAYKTTRDTTKNEMRAAAAAALGEEIDYEKVYYETSSSEDEEESEEDEDKEKAGVEEEIDQDEEEEEEEDIGSFKRIKSASMVRTFKTEPVSQFFNLTQDPKLREPPPPPVVKPPPPPKKKEEVKKRGGKKEEPKPEPPKKEEKDERMEHRLKQLQTVEENTVKNNKSQQKIAQIRKLYDGLMHSKCIPPDDLENVFLHPQAEEVITLSVYTRGEKYRPHTTGVDHGVLQEEEEEVQDRDVEADKRNLMNIYGLKGGKTEIDKYRKEQLNEIMELKQKLARENVFCPVKTIQRAILMPEDALPKAVVERRFPRPGWNLLHNEFAEKKKKKKKKKKKGKKRAK